MEKINFQVGGFGDISVVFVYGNQWFWSKYCPKTYSLLIYHDFWAENDFFWLNWSPRCFYPIFLGFFLRPDKIKSGGVTVLVFRFSDIFSRKMMMFEFFSHQNLKYHQISSNIRFWCEKNSNIIIFREKNPKIEKQKTSVHSILIYLAVHENPNGLAKNIGENN